MPKKFSSSLRSALLSSSPPTLLPHQRIARLTSSHGKSLFTVTLPDTTVLPASLHSKLKNTLWMHRGTYVLVDLEGGDDSSADTPSASSSTPPSSSTPTKAVITGVLTKEQIKEMRRDGSWPKEFVIEEETRVVRGAQQVSEEDEEYETEDECQENSDA